MSWPSFISSSLNDDKYYEAWDEFDAEIRKLKEEDQHYQNQKEEKYDNRYSSI